MKCKRCGADLLDTDTFCIKCGQKVDQPMFCSSCGEQLREGERFCHNCGTPVEFVAEDEEIPISSQRTVDIPFEQIEQGILLEAKQAIVKRPEAEMSEVRSTEGYSRPGAEIPKARSTEDYAYLEAEKPIREKRNVPPSRYEEKYERYEDYDEDDEEEEEDSDGSKMKVLTTVMGIVVIAVALVIGFMLWQRINPFRYEKQDGKTNQSEGQDGETSENGKGNAADVQGRLQILSNVNIRNAPTTDGSEVMMVAKKGETYEYYELVDNAWYRIKLEDGREGYVSAKYVESLE